MINRGRRLFETQYFIGNTVNVLQILHYEIRFQHLALVKNSAKTAALFITCGMKFQIIESVF